MQAPPQPNLGLQEITAARSFGRSRHKLYFPPGWASCVGKASQTPPICVKASVILGSVLVDAVEVIEYSLAWYGVERDIYKSIVEAGGISDRSLID